MPMPNGNVSTDNLDNPTLDKPDQARIDILDAVQQLNELIAMYQQPEGFAGLDANGQVPIAQLPITISTATPSGGNDGDLWFQREADA